MLRQELSTHGATAELRDAADPLRRFVCKLHAPVLNARIELLAKVSARLLRFGAEDGVAATDVGRHAVSAVTLVADGGSLAFAAA